MTAPNPVTTTRRDGSTGGGGKEDLDEHGREGAMELRDELRAT